MAGADEDDYWTNLTGLHEGGARSLEVSDLAVEHIEGVEPLDARFGVGEPLSVPPTLRKALFGQPNVIEGRAVLPLHTYAVLDAARVPGLPEMLEASGLEHACLFQGDAVEDLRDVAHWLVRLEEDHRFTRGLFTRGEAPWEMWDAEPGVLLRGTVSLDDLRKHLRRFTKVRDRAGRWTYFRFWEGDALAAYLATATSDHPESFAFLGRPGRPLISTVVTSNRSGEAEVIRCDAIPDALAEDAGHRLTDVQTRALARAMETRRREEIARAVRDGFPAETEGLSAAALMRLVEDSVHRAGGYGIRSVRHVHLIACWQLIYGMGFETRDPEGILTRIGQAASSEDAKVKSMGDRLSALHRMGVL